MSAKKDWPIRGYWIRFNPKTHKGTVWLNMDDTQRPEVTIDNLEAQEVAALAEILRSGHARYTSDEAVVTEG